MLFRESNGKWEPDLEESKRLENVGLVSGAVFSDLDGDGLPELILACEWGPVRVFHNDGGKGFTRVTEKVGLPSWLNANTAIWFDYDNDGLLDLFVGGYYAEDVDLWHLKTTRMMPESFEYAKNGGRKYLFHNLGHGSFAEVSAQLGIDSRRWALAAAAGDLRVDAPAFGLFRPPVATIHPR